MEYMIIPPSKYTGLFYAITTNRGAICQAFDEAWAARIVTALKLLDAHEKDHPTESYVEALRVHAGPSVLNDLADALEMETRELPTVSGDREEEEP